MGRSSAGGRVLLFGELAALTVSFARELLVLSMAAVQHRERSATRGKLTTRCLNPFMVSSVQADEVC